MDEHNAKKRLLNEADVLQLVKKLLLRWGFILRTTVCFMIFGVVMAVSMVKHYTAEIVVAPESANTSSFSGSLGSLASMVGFDIGGISGNSSDAIYPILYPDVIQSLPFLSSLFDVRVTSLDGSVDTTYYHYVERLRKISWVEYLKGTPKRAMKWLENKFSAPEKVTDPSHFDYYRLSKVQMARIESLSSSIAIFVDKKTNVVSLSFTERDPKIAAIMADTIMSRLQQCITEYRTKKALNDCAYIEKMCEDARLEYEDAQKRYANFVDRNRSLALERTAVERERLESEKDMKNMIYTSWAQQLLLAKAKVQENTPAFTTLKPVSIPVEPSSMRKLYVVLIYTIIGLGFSIMYVLSKGTVVTTFRKLFVSKKS